MHDLKGKQFGRLTVIERSGSDANKNATWLCRCDCGNCKVISSASLVHGDTKSCGCLHRERVSNSMRTHGKSKTRLYRVWAGMKNRCYNPEASNYQYYGALGINVCDEWKDDFVAFESWALLNGYDATASAQECTLDRIDNTKGYSPENCRWANHSDQCNNQSTNRVFTYNGQTHTMSEWAKLVGIKYTTLRSRVRNGMAFEDAISPYDLRTQKSFS